MTTSLSLSLNCELLSILHVNPQEIKAFSQSINIKGSAVFTYGYSHRSSDLGATKGPTSAIIDHLEISDFQNGFS